MAEGYKRELDKVLLKKAVMTEKRYLNVEAYSYDGGQAKVRIRPVSKNTNPNADANKKWINQKAISGITKEEVEGLIVALEQVKTKL